MKEQSRLTRDEWNEFFSGHWSFPGVRQKKHLAAFPEELPRRLIKMFSFVGDTILDPFLGSGTTSLAAKNLGRHSIGYEINGDFLPLISERLGLRQESLFDESEIKVSKQKKANLDYEEDIKKLPYIFQDPIKFDKKVDPRDSKFGSKIDKLKGEPREQYRLVKKVVSPNEMILDNGQRVHLLGVKKKPAKQVAAIQFLKETTKGQRVFLRFDEEQHDKQEDNELFCYLYLKNKTFINAHLIKKGLADVDTESDYKYRARFLKYREPKK
jgi:site-specific DNA-methyltransferase (adenine-specific)